MIQYNEGIRGKLFNYFKGRLNIKQSTKGWWRCDCTDCGGKFTMGINIEGRKVHCFKCGMETTGMQLLMHLEGFSTLPQAHQYLNIQQEYEYYERMARSVRKDFKAIELPESFTLLSQGTSTYGRAARHYMKKRGFNVERLAIKGVGYCTEGEYAGYIIFPFFKKGKLIYFQGRLYIGAGPKMKNPKEEDFGIGKSQIIYNQDALYIYNRVYVLESITNAETLGDTGIATLGKSISQYQLSTMIASPCRRMVLILDPDAYKEAIQSAMQIVNYKKVKVVKLPDGDLDVNNYGMGKTLDFVKQTEYSTYIQLFRIRIQLNTGSNEERPITTYQRVGPHKVDRRGL
jgi:DNA primase